MWWGESPMGRTLLPLPHFLSRKNYLPRVLFLLSWGFQTISRNTIKIERLTILELSRLNPQVLPEKQMCTNTNEFSVESSSTYHSFLFRRGRLQGKDAGGKRGGKSSSLLPFWAGGGRRKRNWHRFGEGGEGGSFGRPWEEEGEETWVLLSLLLLPAAAAGRKIYLGKSKREAEKSERHFAALSVF